MSDDVLRLYTIYDHPRDYPKWFVLRSFAVLRGNPEPQGESPALLFKEVERARAWCEERGLTCIGKEPDDDPCIVETWI